MIGESSSNLPPAAFGRYRVLHEIGVGSLGPAFRGEDSDTRAPVFIKSLHLNLEAQEATRLAAALQALTRSVPRASTIARPIAAGVQDGRLYFVTAWREGVRLDEAWRQFGPAVITDALPRLQRLADVLDAAARADCWHGALHPGRILIDGDDTLLLGVGLAPVLERRGIRCARREGYTPPEVTAGHPSAPAADQFVLAVVAHEWLFGRRPTVRTNDVLDLPAMPGVDHELLAAAFEVALSPSAGSRFVSCAAFVEAIRRSVVAERASPVVASAPTVLAPIEVAAAPLFASEMSDDTPRDPAEVVGEPPSLETPVLPPPATPSWSTASIVAAALVCGVAVGAVGGYLLNRWRAQPAGQDVAAAAADAPQAQQGGREFTETAVDVPAAPRSEEPPVAGDAAVEPVPAVAGGTLAVRPDVARAVTRDAARVLIRSTPAGAQVTVDGVARGTTPLALRDLSYGTHIVQIGRAGYTTAERSVTLTSERPSRSIEVGLETLSAGLRSAASSTTASASLGGLIVQSRPAGAAVTVDGRAIGSTPVTLDSLAPGSHIVRIERSGYRPWTTRVEVRAGERARVAASLVGEGQE